MKTLKDRGNDSLLPCVTIAGHPIRPRISKVGNECQAMVVKLPNGH